MKLSELNTGESGVIVKVSGHGGFRKRIIEMGFIKGKKVDVLLNAPLQDPVKYKIMGYEVSLRHSEADHIEVVSVNEAKKDKQLKHADEEEREQVINSQAVDSEDSDEQALGDKMLVAEQEADRLHHVINVALIGNPNCGKTSLFNFASGAHERVGNYSGVTVDAKVGEAEYNAITSTLSTCLVPIRSQPTRPRNSMCASSSSSTHPISSSTSSTPATWSATSISPLSSSICTSAWCALSICSTRPRNEATTSTTTNWANSSEYLWFLPSSRTAEA